MILVFVSHSHQDKVTVRMALHKFLFSSTIKVLCVLVAHPLRSTRFILHLRSWETCWNEHGSASDAPNQGHEFALVSYCWALWWLHVTVSRSLHPAFCNKWVLFHFHHHHCVKFSSLHIPPQHLLSSPAPSVVCDFMCVTVCVCLSVCLMSNMFWWVYLQMSEQGRGQPWLSFFRCRSSWFLRQSLIGLRLGKQGMLAGQGAPQVYLPHLPTLWL